MSKMWWRAGTAVFAMTLALQAHAAGLTVATRTGIVQGVATPGALDYLGIPYAQPPLGPLRWAPPRPVSWPGVLQADTLPSPCPQNPGDFSVASTDENCLFLNIYAPVSGARNLPVMVWIHGGADETGTGDEYDGTALVQDGVIVVTINYRLGYLGFLAHPALDAESFGRASGDYGLMDQQAALRWVRDNIAAFGGNPGRVTVFGESAGGQNILDHLVSPGATGLFQRAIIESGAYAVQLPSLATADRAGVAFATAAGCTSTTDAACLRALPVSAILAAEAAGAPGSAASLTQFEPNVGTAVLPVQPLIAIAAGVLNRVPVMQGSNHDEARLFTALEFDSTGRPLAASGYDQAIAGLVGAPITPFVASIYPLAHYPTPDLAYATLFTDVGFSCSARGFDQLLSRSVPVYNYEFSDENAGALLLPADPFLAFGAPHTSELPFLWPLLPGSNGVSGSLMTPAEMELATQMRAAWTNFARSGNPNGPGVAPWTAYDSRTDRFQELIPPGAAASTGFNADHKCAVWEPILTLDGVLPPGSL